MNATSERIVKLTEDERRGIKYAVIGISIYIAFFIGVAIYTDMPIWAKGPVIILIAFGNYSIFMMIGCIAFLIAGRTALSNSTKGETK